ncbi:MAG: SDR family oxidoreductase, partial [Saprospiraceae bacterium]|nr:SDR family oxidoreductase [Saprospiraceae bacterium]
MQKLLVAGSTGYLGSHIVKELIAQNLHVTAVARNTQKLESIGLFPSQIIKAEVTDPASLEGCCDGMDIVISAVGITRQKDGLTYMDVDYQANRNLLEQAIKSRVKKFIYVSVLHGEKLTHLKICEAKERFVRELQESGMNYCIIRPSGFFSDMKAFYDMAKSGRVYLFGDGLTKANPIHGTDLAKVCIDAISTNERVIEIGGKEMLSHKDIAEIAFEVVGKTPKITYIPDWIRKFMLWLSSIFMSKANYGTTEFFLNVMAIDMATHS